jgi:hypothetical protein
MSIGKSQPPDPHEIVLPHGFWIIRAYGSGTQHMTRTQHSNRFEIRRLVGFESEYHNGELGSKRVRCSLFGACRAHAVFGYTSPINSINNALTLTPVSFSAVTEFLSSLRVRHFQFSTSLIPYNTGAPQLEHKAFAMNRSRRGAPYPYPHTR